MSKKKKSSTSQEDLIEGALAPHLPEPTEEKNEERKETMGESVSVEKTKNTSLRTIGMVILVLVVIAVIASIPAVYFYNQYKSMQAKMNPTAATQAQITSLIGRVGQLMLLPSDETPTVATVSDKSKWSGQPFFAKVENGDQVLMYQKAKKAIIYRPSTNKIVEVGPVNIQASNTPTTIVAGASTQSVSSGQASATLSQTPSGIKVALYNGTSTSGLTRKAEPLVSSSGAKVIAKENAAKDSYTTTQVVVLNSQASVEAQKIATSLKGSVVSILPNGENKPDADILVILGADFGK